MIFLTNSMRSALKSEIEAGSRCAALRSAWFALEISDYREDSFEWFRVILIEGKPCGKFALRCTSFRLVYVENKFMFAERVFTI